MPDAPAPSQATAKANFRRYLPLSAPAGELWKHRTDKPGPDPAPETPVPALSRGKSGPKPRVLLLGGQNWTARPVLANLAPFPETEVHKPINPGSAAAYAGSHSRPDARAYPGACRPRWNPGWSDEPKLKPRWDVHLGGDDDQLGCAGESLSSVLGECPGSVFDPPICAFHLGFSLGGLLAYAFPHFQAQNRLYPICPRCRRATAGWMRQLDAAASGDDGCEKSE